MNRNSGTKCSWCDTPIDWRNKDTVKVDYHGFRYEYCSLDHGAWGLGRMDTFERQAKEPN